MKVKPKRKKIPVSTAIDPEALAIWENMAEAFGVSKVKVLEEMFLQYGRRALKRKEKSK